MIILGIKLREILVVERSIKNLFSWGPMFWPPFLFLLLIEKQQGVATKAW